MFLDDIRGHLCPDQQNHNRYRTCYPHHVKCLICERVVDVYNIIFNASCPENPFLSANLAHSYANWTGDIHVPCKYIFKINCGKILPACVDTKLSHLLKGLEILKALNYPFFGQQQIEEGENNNNNSKPPNKEIFNNLMKEYISLMDKVTSNNESSSSSSNSKINNGEILALRVILTNMKSAFDEVDIFDQYFNVLVPHVQSRHKELQQHLFSSSSSSPPPPNFILPEDSNNNNFVGNALYSEILKSDFIRNTFSKYCISFDVAYVMALCFICGDDTNLVYNLVLDLGARLCNRFFYLDNNVESQNETNKIITKFLTSNITPRKNLDLYYFIRKFPEQVEECFSDDFIKKFSELDRAVKTRFENVFITTTTTTTHNNNNNNKLLKYGYQQTFPYILFQGKDEEYYGFITALAYYCSKKSISNNSTTTTSPKGLIPDCRKIYRFVKNCIYRIREMQQNSSAGGGGGGEDVYWTRDTFNLFLCTDSRFEKELMTMFEMVLDGVEKK